MIEAIGLWVLSLPIGWALSAAGGTLAGALTSAAMTAHFQRRRDRRDLTVSLVKDFSSLDSHKLRVTFWAFMHKVEGKPTFAVLDGIADEKEREAFRYVLGFFVNAGTLIRSNLINRKLFFSLAERWMLEIAEKHLFVQAERETQAHYRVHREALVALEKAWRKTSGSPQPTPPPPR